eukprot:TRINITY_DN66355_c7_g8_i2.p1 TRINITY_DN66355_c7_g8~~TRINITY_DN66355_c7_g8_i2.p1  ORF type:complete len:151 (-),score=16.66 TRINITY_DN66355_c7_g8_i2:154-606(-)
MSRPGFEKRLRDFLASEELEETINNFLSKNAKYVSRESDTNNGQGEIFSCEVHEIWKDYLEIMERAMTDFQKSEDLDDIEFKKSVEDVADRAPMMVKLMIASWEFSQFVEICKDYLDNLEEEDDDDDDDCDGKYNEDYSNDYKSDRKDEK